MPIVFLVALGVLLCGAAALLTIAAAVKASSQRRGREALEAPEPTLRTRARPDAETSCPFCHAAVEDSAEPAACTACFARHHRACWDEHGACATCGHAERFAAVERTAGAIRRSRAQAPKA